MIGQQQITLLDASDIIRGMTSSSELNDGGFSNETEAVNLINTPGAVYAPAALVNADTDTILDGHIIASCADGAASASFNRMVVTSDGDFMTYNGTKLADVTGGQDTTQTYQKGFTDMVPWAGRIYVTSKEYLTEWVLPSTFTSSFQFAAMANSAVPHPLLVYENNLYIADGNLLKRMTSAGGSVSTILTLASGDFIQAMGVDQGSGKMVLSIVNGQNISATLSRPSKVAWYDGFSNKFLKVIQVEDMVTAFHSHRGITYVGYGQNLGYLTGSGVQFLRKLKNVALDSTELPYKHNFSSIGETLCVLDDFQVLAYGPVRTGGENVFYYIAYNRVDTNNFSCIFNAGNNKLGLGIDTSNKFYTLDVTSVATIDQFDFYTKTIPFPRPIHPKAIIVEYADTTSDSSSNNVIGYKTQDREAGKGLTLFGGTATYTYELNPLIGFIEDEQVRSMKLNIVNVTKNKGIKRIILYYDPAE